MKKKRKRFITDLKRNTRDDTNKIDLYMQM